LRVWGDPAEYKGILIHPVTMDNCEIFYNSVSCLMYEKNKIQDVQVIKMDYLTFIFALIQQDKMIYERLIKIFDLVFQNQDYKFKFTELGKIHMVVDDIEISGHEFDILRNFILEENGIRIEEILDSEMEFEMQRLEEYRAKENGVPATLEERIITLHCLSSISYQAIRKYTLYQFGKSLERHAIIKNFEVYSALLAENGASKDIVHFLSHVEERGRFDNLAMSEAKFNEVTSIGNKE
jgi:hypothetical protein